MPSPDSIKNSHWVLFQKKRQQWIGEFAKLTTEEAKKYKPNCTVEHQNSTSLLNCFLGVNENMSKASDYCGGDLYGGIEEHSFACKMYYNLTQNQPFEYMTSRCYPGLGEHTTTKSYDMLLQSVLMTYAHHGASLFIDAIDPVGTLDERVYESVGEVFRLAERFEPYLEGTLVQEVGIYYNLNAKMEAEHEGIIGFSSETKELQTHQKAVLGAAKALRENHIPFGVINNWKLNQLEKLRVLVLSDSPFMEDRELHAIRDFVINGGHLYFSGRSAPILVEEIFGVKYEGLTEETVTYMSPSAAGKDLMSQFTYNYPMTVLEKQVILSGSGNGEVLATMTLPYTVPPVSMALFAASAKNDKTSENNMLPKFAAIHSNPPGKFTKRPSIMRTSSGMGKVIWSAAPFEAAIREQHSAIFTAIIRELGGNFSFYSNAPDAVELVMFSVPEKNRQLISLINVQERFKVIEINNFEIFIKAEMSPMRVTTLTDGKEIPYKHTDGEVIIHIDRLALFEMVAIDF